MKVHLLHRARDFDFGADLPPGHEELIRDLELATLLQAMAAGLPVACLDVGDVRRIVAPSNHPFVARAGDDPGFAEALVRLARDEATRRAVGEANRGRARADFGLESICEPSGALFAGTAAEPAQ